MFIAFHLTGRIRTLLIRLITLVFLVSQFPLLTVNAQTPDTDFQFPATDSSLQQQETPTPDVEVFPQSTPEIASSSSLLIESVEPSEIMAGSADLTLTLFGSGFSIDSIVHWQAVPLVTTFVSEHNLKAVLPAELTRETGDFSIVVSNPAPMAADSNSVPVSVSNVDPLPLKKLTSNAVIFNWLDTPGALSYRLQLSLTDDFAALLLDLETPISAYLTETLLAEHQVYFWRTSAWDGLAWSDWSETWSFYSMSPPVAPQLVAPIDRAKINQAVTTLAWSAVENGDHYRVQISTTDLFETILEDISLGSGVLEHTVTSLPDGRYYWRVCAYDEVAVQGDWSTAWFFKIDTVPPPLPPLLKPLDGALVTTTTPKFKVAAVQGGRFYHFQVAADADFVQLLTENPSVTAVDGSATWKLTTTEALPFGKVYWRARAIDQAGNLSGWTAVRTINVNILRTPAHKSYTFSQKPSFSWSPAAGAQLYRLQISTTSEFDEQNGDITLEKELSSVTSYTPGHALPYNKYYWRVQVQTAAGWSNWTPAFILTITSSVPMTTPLSGPGSGTITGDSTPRLRWVEAFPLYSPQLRIHHRLIHVYLPSDYSTSGKSYPVIYLHDGVQMFNTDGNNEYHLDETLDSLIEQGRLEGVIAVGIDHSDNRWDELSPWINYNMDRWYAWNAKSAEGGEGNQYLDFIINTLKPEIDRRYRTLPDRENTAIGGGSMGGIISLYAGLKYPQVFSKVIMFSPVLWFGEVNGAWLSNNQIINYINQYPVPQNVKFFTYIGTAECYGRRIDVLDAKGRPVTYPQVLLEGAQVLVKTLRARGVPEENLKYIENPGGVHQPYMWGYYFDEALLWLYKDQVLPDYVPSGDPPMATGSMIASYQLQLSRSADFSRVVQTITLPDNTSVDTELLPKDGVYYWRVRAVNDLGIPGPWSQTRWFSLDTVPPAATKLISPADGMLVRTTTPLFQVAYVSGASRYHFQVSSDPDFSTLLYSREALTNSAQLSVSKALPFGQLYWRARTLDQVGNPSAWSAVRSLYINTLKSPADGKPLTDTTPYFSWASAAGALKYRLQVAHSSEFLEDGADVVIDEFIGGSKLGFSPVTPLDYGHYYWRLQVKTSNGWSHWTPVFSFDLSTKPMTPVIVSPVNKEVVTLSTPVLNWEVVTDPVVDITGYLVQISSSKLFTPILQSTQVTEPYYTTSALPDGKYFWRVRAINALGVKGTWSTTGVFIVSATP